MFFVWFIRIRQQASTQNVPDGVKKGRLFYSAIAPHPASTHPASTRSGADGVARIFRQPDGELASGTNRLGRSRLRQICGRPSRMRLTESMEHPSCPTCPLFHLNTALRRTLDPTRTAVPNIRNRPATQNLA